MPRPLALLTLALLLLLGWGYGEATRSPVVRRATLAMPGWPAGAPPLRVALLTDLHVAGPDMPPERLRGIVARVNAEKPDIILLGGDYFGDGQFATSRYSDDAIVAPLAALRAPLGVFAILGNHDHWRGAPAIGDALERAGVRVLVNEAVRVGPLTLGGVDDAYTRHARYRLVERRAAALPGPTLMLSHTPDVAPKLSARFPLILAGHTHCGQIVLPVIGPLATASELRRSAICGASRLDGHLVIVSAGLGTSLVPLRYGAPPDWWLLTLGSGG